MKRPKISVALATYNEEENIVDCLKSVADFADEIVIADGSSTDRTRDLAIGLGAKVIKTTNKPMFHINKNLSINNCTGNWIFLMDADERVNKELADEIKQKVVSQPKENGFWVNRKNWFLGGFLTKGGAHPDSIIRLFKNGKGRLAEITVHEQVTVDGEVGHLQGYLLHFADPSFSRYLLRADKYTTETAQKLVKINPGRGIGQLIYYMFLKPMFIFFKIYFRHKGYVDGFRGFVWALFSSLHYYFAYVKYWEKSQKLKL